VELNEFRQATRLVGDDLASAASATVEALGRGVFRIEDFEGPHPVWMYEEYLPTDGWASQRPLLARYLPRQAWLKVSGAFSDINGYQA
jgi:hypothetical protein